MTDDSSTDPTVLLESRSDVDDRTEATDDMRMDAAGGAESVVGAECAECRQWGR